MTRVIFKHIRRTRNLGDAWCSPYDHIRALHRRWQADVRDLTEVTPPCDAVIYGGGKITGGLHSQLGPQDFAARRRIAWGVSTVQKVRWAPRYLRTYRTMDLVGSREWGDDRFAFAPCASCMAPEFDQPYEEQHEVVAYLHHWQAPKAGLKVPPGIPVLDNTCDSFAQAIRFLGSARTVVSNSYHGVYWALLLGKKVLCIPFSKKFYGYRVSPGYADPSNWNQMLGQSAGSDEMLDLCRSATALFAERVVETIESH